MYRYFLGGACLLIFTVFCSINSFILFRGAYRWGHDDLDKIALGVAAAVVPWVIAILPATISETWRSTLFGLHRPSIMTVGVALAWVGFVAYNLIGGSGTIAQARFENVAEVESRIDTAAQAKAARAIKLERLQALPQARPIGTVEQLLAAEKTSKLWQRSGKCQDATSKSTRGFCDRVLTLTSELETAREAAKLEQEIASLSDQAVSVGPVVASADPQAEMLSDATGVKVAVIQRWLPAATPIMLEIGAAVMLHVALGVLKIRLEEPSAGPPAAGNGLVAIASPDSMRTASVASVEALTAQRSLAEWFFRECSRPLPSGSMSEVEWYDHYREVCRRSNDRALPMESFRRIASRFIPTIQDIDGVVHYQGALPTIPQDMAS